MPNLSQNWNNDYALIEPLIYEDDEGVNSWLNGKQDSGSKQLANAMKREPLELSLDVSEGRLRFKIGAHRVVE